WLPAVSQSAGHGLEAKRAAPAVSPPRPTFDGKRHANPGCTRLDLARAAALRAPSTDVGGRRACRDVRGRAGGLSRVPHVSHLRLLLRAAVGPRRAAPAPARLQGLSRSDRAPAGDRLRHAVLP